VISVKVLHLVSSLSSGISMDSDFKPSATLKLFHFLEPFNTRINITKLFCSVADRGMNKLERLSLEKFFQAS